MHVLILALTSLNGHSLSGLQLTTAVLLNRPFSVVELISTPERGVLPKKNCGI